MDEYFVRIIREFSACLILVFVKRFNTPLSSLFCGKFVTQNVRESRHQFCLLQCFVRRTKRNGDLGEKIRWLAFFLPLIIFCLVFREKKLFQEAFQLLSKFLSHNSTPLRSDFPPLIFLSLSKKNPLKNT